MRERIEGWDIENLSYLWWNICDMNQRKNINKTTTTTTNRQVR